LSRKSITIEDVAQAAGVSRQTVSRVINRKTNVREAVRARVEAVIAELGYVPSTAARRMGGARSHLLLAVIERGAATAGAGARTGRLPLDAMLLAGIDACSPAGYHILFEQLETDQAESLARLGRTLTAHSPDGVIFTPPLDARKDLRAAVDKRAIAIEFMGERRDFGRTSPGIDDGALGEAVTRHLITLGHRQIGFIAGCADKQRSKQRIAGYTRMMARHANRAHRHFTADQQLDFADAMALAKSWLVPTIRPTAIIAETEEVALAILDVAAALGISVPQELSLISLEERASLARAKPPIAAMFQPYEVLFKQACERLIARTGGANGAEETAQGGKSPGDAPPSPFELIERASLAKAPRAV